jgi:hypothetical protein
VAGLLLAQVGRRGLRPLAAIQGPRGGSAVLGAAHVKVGQRRSLRGVRGRAGRSVKPWRPPVGRASGGHTRVALPPVLGVGQGRCPLPEAGLELLQGEGPGRGALLLLEALLRLQLPQMPVPALLGSASWRGRALGLGPPCRLRRSGRSSS